MAEPDCGLCRVAGYRSCDRCGGPVLRPVAGAPDVCTYCAGASVPDLLDLLRHKEFEDD